MNILVASDGSAYAREAQQFLRAIIHSAHNSVTLATVIDDTALASRWPESVENTDELVAEELSESETALQDQLQKFSSENWIAKSICLTGHTSPKILELAKQKHADLIVLGARGLSQLRKHLLGSVSSRIVRHAGCSVLVYRNEHPENSAGPADELKILVAYDGSASADRAIEAIKAISWKLPLRILLVHVIELVEAFNMDAIQHATPQWKKEVEQTKAELDQVAAQFKQNPESVEVQVHQSGDTAEEILQTADVWKPDLIVLGHQGRSALTQFLLGSVAFRVSDQAKCSVLVVRGED